MIEYRKISARLKRIAQNESGSALVEVAISAVSLMSVFLAVFQVTMACYTYNAVCETARESARWVAVRGSTCSTNTPNLDHCGATSSDIQDHAQAVSALNWSQCTSTPCVAATWMTATTTTGTQQTTTTWAACGTSSTCKAPGNLVVVTVTYPYTLNFPMVKSYSLSLKSTSEMVVAQ